ncbi:hypothetical protein [Streptomyces sp. NPDC127190]|uniref:hypothetical protein n=1 Tax=unclassified Streptomyces TaxID=2593676 RepID=UPI00362D4B8A
MSEDTPSQAEGEREPDTATAGQPPRTTPSQAEGEDTEEDGTGQARHGGKPGLAQHLREEPRTPIQEEFDR